MPQDGSVRTITSWLRCKQCGDLWYSNAAQEMLENGEECLTCRGELELLSEQVHGTGVTPVAGKRSAEPAQQS